MTEPLVSLPADATRERLGGVLQSLDAAVELSPTEKNQLIAQVDRDLMKEGPYRLLEIYKAAGAKDKLIVLGDRYFKETCGLALEIYEAAGAKDKLIALGDWCFFGPGESGFIGQQAYIAAGAKEKLLTVGDHFMERGYLNAAQYAYEAAGAKDKLVTIGDRYLQQGDIHLAAKAYTAAGTTTKRIAIADRFLQGIPTGQIIAWFQAHHRS